MRILQMANEAGAKAYVRSLSLSLHEELKSHGIHVTVLPPASVDTPVLEKFGFDPATMPMKPMSVDRRGDGRCGATAVMLNGRVGSA